MAIPLSELAKHDVYREQISRSLQVSVNKDSVNLFDDQPELVFGPEVNGKSTDGGVPPFYVSLRIHDKILHNAMFDSSASHNGCSLNHYEKHGYVKGWKFVPLNPKGPHKIPMWQDMHMKRPSFNLIMI